MKDYYCNLNLSQSVKFSEISCQNTTYIIIKLSVAQSMVTLIIILGLVLRAAKMALVLKAAGKRSLEVRVE